MSKAANNIESTIGQKVIEFLEKTPIAVAVPFFAFLSGQLWVFIIIAYVKSSQKGNKALQTIASKTGLGVCWFTFIMVPIYVLKHGGVNFEYPMIIDLTIPTIVGALFFQVIVFALFAQFKK